MGNSDAVFLPGFEMRRIESFPSPNLTSAKPKLSILPEYKNFQNGVWISSPSGLQLFVGAPRCGWWKIGGGQENYRVQILFRIHVPVSFFAMLSCSEGSELKCKRK